MEDDPQTPCECGHARNYHVPDVIGGEEEMGIGHFCEFENCDCMDFVPAFDDEDD